MTLEASLPTLFTTQRGINQPRSASLSGIFMARKKPLKINSLKDIGLDEKILGPSDYDNLENVLKTGSLGCTDY